MAPPHSGGDGRRCGMGGCRSVRHGGGAARRRAGPGTAPCGLDERRCRLWGPMGGAHRDAPPPSNSVDGGQGKRQAATQLSCGVRRGGKVGAEGGRAGAVMSPYRVPAAPSRRPRAASRHPAADPPRRYTSAFRRSGARPPPPSALAAGATTGAAGHQHRRVGGAHCGAWPRPRPPAHPDCLWRARAEGAPPEGRAAPPPAAHRRKGAVAAHGGGRPPDFTPVQ